MPHYTFQQKFTRRYSKGRIRDFGPYWYAFWREGKRVRCSYIGKDLRPDQWRDVHEGRASARRAFEEKPAQTTIDFSPEEMLQVDGYEPITISPHAGREAARKIYYWRCKRSNVTAEGRLFYQRDFAVLCHDRGWKLPRS